eukprot:CAMPEP_0197520706 /NCGR_PEP_ID=MMETSP1318-20131121/6039_1 /TAXON_ID=552666 /ORGANISM="Partenskyella glossopodia, Strain RCC365" /LENGTH=472 /DNA_ID=CAMNT_0043072403 /DNA_START=194 /DNA_END=1612 /DNA_ORIENTATION=-
MKSGSKSSSSSRAKTPPLPATATDKTSHNRQLKELTDIFLQFRKLRRKFEKIVGKSCSERAERLYSKCATLRMRTVLLKKRLQVLGSGVKIGKGSLGSEDFFKTIDDAQKWVERFQNKLSRFAGSEASLSASVISPPLSPPGFQGRMKDMYTYSHVSNEKDHDSNDKKRRKQHSKPNKNTNTRIKNNHKTHTETSYVRGGGKDKSSDADTCQANVNANGNAATTSSRTRLKAVAAVSKLIGMYEHLKGKKPTKSVSAIPDDNNDTKHHHHHHHHHHHQSPNQNEQHNNQSVNEPTHITNNQEKKKTFSIDITPKSPEIQQIREETAESESAKTTEKEEQEVAATEPELKLEAAAAADPVPAVEAISTSAKSSSNPALLESNASHASEMLTQSHANTEIFTQSNATEIFTQSDGEITSSSLHALELQSKPTRLTLKIRLPEDTPQLGNLLKQELCSALGIEASQLRIVSQRTD